MPNLGDTARGKDIGKSDRLYIWAACPDCDNSRWVVSIYGEPKSKFCKHCNPKHQPHYSHGRRTKEGYVYLLIPQESPYAKMRIASGLVLEHRLVMATYLGRCLSPEEIVHHKNGVRDDNRLANLELMPSQREHLPTMGMQKRILELEREILKQQRLIIYLLRSNQKANTQI